MKLLVLGLDGENYEGINRYIGVLPTYKRLLKQYHHNILYCDAEVAHSTPAWLLAFSGKFIRDHGMICFFDKKASADKLWRRSDFRFPFIWNILAGRGYRCKTLAIKCFGELVNFNNNIDASHEVTHPTTYDECMRNIEWGERRVLEALKEDLDFFAWTSPLPDHVEHTFREEESDINKISEHQYIAVRKALDLSLKNILKVAEKTAENIVIVSDHGIPAGWSTYDGIEDLTHNRDGIIITNRDSPPKKLSELFNWMLEVFD